MTICVRMLASCGTHHCSTGQTYLVEGPVSEDVDEELHHQGAVRVADSVATAIRASREWVVEALSEVVSCHACDMYGNLGETDLANAPLLEHGLAVEAATGTQLASVEADGDVVARGHRGVEHEAGVALRDAVPGRKVRNVKT